VAASVFLLFDAFKKCLVLRWQMKNMVNRLALANKCLELPKDLLDIILFHVNGIKQREMLDGICLEIHHYLARFWRPSEGTIFREHGVDKFIIYCGGSVVLHPFHGDFNKMIQIEYKKEYASFLTETSFDIDVIDRPLIYFVRRYRSVPIAGKFEQALVRRKRKRERRDQRARYE